MCSSSDESNEWVSEKRYKDIKTSLDCLLTMHGLDMKLKGFNCWEGVLGTVNTGQFGHGKGKHEPRSGILQVPARSCGDPGSWGWGGGGSLGRHDTFLTIPTMSSLLMLSRWGWTTNWSMILGNVGLVMKKSKKEKKMKTITPPEINYNNLRGDPKLLLHGWAVKWEQGYARNWTVGKT